MKRTRLLLTCALTLGSALPALAQAPSPPPPEALKQAEARGAARALLEQAAFAETHERERERAAALYAKALEAARLGADKALAARAQQGQQRCGKAAAEAKNPLPPAAYSLLDDYARQDHSPQVHKASQGLLLYGARLVPVLEELIYTGYTYDGSGLGHRVPMAAAVELLATLRTPRAEAALVDLARHEDPLLRREAVANLDATRHLKLIQSVLDKEKVPGVWSEAVEALTQAKTSPQILEGLRYAALRGSRPAMDSLARRDPGQLPGLLSHPDLREGEGRVYLAMLIDNEISNRRLLLSDGGAFDLLLAHCAGPSPRLEATRLASWQIAVDERFLWSEPVRARRVEALLMPQPPQHLHERVQSLQRARNHSEDVAAALGDVAGMALVEAAHQTRLKGKPRLWADAKVYSAALNLGETPAGRERLLAWLAKQETLALPRDDYFWHAIVIGLCASARDEEGARVTATFLLRALEKLDADQGISFLESLSNPGDATLLGGDVSQRHLRPDRALGSVFGTKLAEELEASLLRLRPKKPQLVDAFLKPIAGPQTLQSWLWRDDGPADISAELRRVRPVPYGLMIKAIRDPSTRGAPLGLAKIALQLNQRAEQGPEAPAAREARTSRQAEILAALRARLGSEPSQPDLLALLPFLDRGTSVAIDIAHQLLAGGGSLTAQHAYALQVLATAKDDRLWSLFPRLWNSKALSKEARAAFEAFRKPLSPERLDERLEALTLALLQGKQGPGYGRYFLYYADPIATFTRHRAALSRASWYWEIAEEFRYQIKEGYFPVETIDLLLPRKGEELTPSQRQELALLVGRTAYGGGLEFLQRCLRDPHPEVRRSATSALTDLDDARRAEEELARLRTGVADAATRELLSLVRDPDAKTSELALATLGQVAEADALPAMIRLVKELPRERHDQLVDAIAQVRARTRDTVAKPKAQ